MWRQEPQMDDRRRQNRCFSVRYLKDVDQIVHTCIFFNISWHMTHRIVTVDSKVCYIKYPHGFVVICFAPVKFLVDSSELFTHICQGCFTSPGAIKILEDCPNASDLILHDDVIKWKHFPRYWPFVRRIHRSPVNSPHKGQWCGALMFSLICARINGWVNNG